MNQSRSNISLRFSNLIRSEFVKYNIIFFLGSIGVGFFNYLYQMLSARLLGPADYSVVAAMLSLTYIILLPGSPVTTVAMKYASTFNAKGRPDLIRGFISTLTKYLLPCGMVIFLVLVAFSGYIASFFNIQSQLPVILIALTAVLSSIIVLNRGVLQGLKRFLPLTVNISIEAISKVLLAVALILLGYRANGAIFAIFLAMMIGYAASLVPLRDFLGKGPFETPFKELLGYSGAVLATGLGLMLLLNIDILLVKHYFSAYQAGIYAAVSAMGKIVFFVSVPVAGVMFPMVSELHERNEKHHHLVNRSLLLVLAISAGILLVYLGAPKLVIGILFGSKFLSAAPYLLPLGIFGTLLSLTGVFINYFLSTWRKGFIPFLLGFGALMAGLVSWLHASLAQVIMVIVLSMALLVGVMSILYMKTYIDQR